MWHHYFKSPSEGSLSNAKPRFQCCERVRSHRKADVFPSRLGDERQKRDRYTVMRRRGRTHSRAGCWVIRPVSAGAHSYSHSHASPNNRDQRVDAARRRPPTPRRFKESCIARVHLSGLGRTGTQHIVVRAMVVGETNQKHPTTGDVGPPPFPTSTGP